MGSVAYNHPIGKDYKWYISGIYCQLGDYIASWWFQPVLNNISQIGSFPKVEMKIKNIKNHNQVNDEFAESLSKKW